MIDFNSCSTIPKSFSKKLNQNIPLPGPLDLHFGPKKDRKSTYFVKNGGSRSIIWIKIFMLFEIEDGLFKSRNMSSLEMWGSPSMNITQTGIRKVFVVMILFSLIHSHINLSKIYTGNICIVYIYGISGM